MYTEIVLPALSPQMTEAMLTKWHVQVGQKVEPGQVIAQVETDKTTFELEAHQKGVVAELLVPEGLDPIAVDTPIARLRQQIDEGAASSQESPSKAAGRIFASPLARRMAREAKLDLRQLRGTGPRGRIVAADVEKWLSATAQRRSEQIQPAADETVQPLARETEGEAPRPAASSNVLQLTTMRKTIARRMTDSFRDVPQFALNMDVELDRMLECRTRINAQLEPSGLKVSVTDFVLKAAALALMRVPEVNASYTSEGIIMHPHADVALAVALPDGLVAPVLRQVEAKGLAAIAREARELTELARTKRIEPRHIEGGTFSVSNLGMLAVKSFTSIINAPHAAILSVGAAEARPVIKLGQVAIATMMTVTLTCDHRAIDGATGARWLREFKASIEEPATMLA